jgi:hypothetical protein
MADRSLESRVPSPEPRPEAPALHIAREHQSAPAEHWADKEVAKAAEEIRGGQFTPVAAEEDDLLAIGLQRGLAIKNPAQLAGNEKLALFEQTADSVALAQHPRVQEMLVRLEKEKNDAQSSQEMLEKTAMLHEANQRAARKNLWDGQGRWLGKAAEEMRIVNILSWQQWLGRLTKVIGEDRVFVSEGMRAGRKNVLVPKQGAGGRGQRLASPYSLIPDPSPYEPVATIQPVNPEWMVMRFSEYGEPTCPKYLGWRTPLLSLIAQRIITEKEAHRAFPLGSGPAADWYRQQLFELRSREGVLA